jgi:hypothetical protein
MSSLTAAVVCWVLSGFWFVTLGLRLWLGRGDWYPPTVTTIIITGILLALWNIWLLVARMPRRIPVPSVVMPFLIATHNFRAAITSDKKDELIDGWLYQRLDVRYAFEQLVEAVRPVIRGIDTTESARSYAAALALMADVLKQMSLKKVEVRNALAAVMTFAVLESLDERLSGELEPVLVAIVGEDFVDMLRKERESNKRSREEKQSSFTPEQAASSAARFNCLRIAQMNLLRGLVKALAKEAE